MAKILNWIKVEKKLKESGLIIFRPWDLVRLFKVSRSAANFFIYRNTKKGLIVRLKKSRNGSLYSLPDHLSNNYLIANCLYEPSYISFDAALSFHGIIPETVYAITSATPKTTRSYDVEGVNYNYLRIKKGVYTGYRPIRHGGSIIFMAEPEKAIADYLYFVALKKRDLDYERINLKNIKYRKLLGYIKLFKQPAMLAILKGIYADARKPQRIY